MTGQIRGSLIKIQNTAFAVIETSYDTLSNAAKANTFVRAHSFIFPNYPIVLLAYNEASKPVYYGKPELVKLLTNVHPNQIPWKIYHYRK